MKKNENFEKIGQITGDDIDENIDQYDWAPIIEKEELSDANLTNEELETYKKDLKMLLKKK